MCSRSGKYSVCGRVRASFSLEILQARAVKGLNQHVSVSNKRGDGGGGGGGAEEEAGGGGRGEAYPNIITTPSKADFA